MPRAPRPIGLLFASLLAWLAGPGPVHGAATLELYGNYQAMGVGGRPRAARRPEPQRHRGRRVPRRGLVLTTATFAGDAVGGPAGLFYRASGVNCAGREGP